MGLGFNRGRWMEWLSTAGDERWGEARIGEELLGVWGIGKLGGVFFGCVSDWICNECKLGCRGWILVRF